MTIETTTIETSLVDGCATLWLNRPERLNALNVELIDAACERLAAWGVDPEVRVIVLRGRGRSFCAGDDVKGMRDGSAHWEEMDRTLRREGGYERLFHQIYQTRKPVIAAWHGYAVGAGALIGLACDIRIAASDAKIGFVFVKRGITGGTTIVARYIGLGKAHELLLTGDTVSGDEAERIGLVNVSVPAEQLDATVDEWVAKFRKAPTKVLGFTKYAIHHGLYQPLDTAFALNTMASLLTPTAHDSAEGRQAFREKRAPNFSGT